MAWWSRPVVRWRGRPVPVFPVVGAMSVAAAIGLGWALGRAVGIPAAALAAMAAAALGALVVDVVGQAAARGRVDLVAFREAGLALAAAAVCCAALGHGVRPGLDVAAVAVAAGLAGGRLGCLAAGCCHGRLARVGVRYGAEHVALGFPGGVGRGAGRRGAGVGAAALAVLASVGAGLAVGAPAGAAFGVLAGG